ncbi:MAG: cytochrome c [Sphingomonadales bacterium]|nr:cytochrome c [Sphingomonadales bacterium]
MKAGIFVAAALVATFTAVQASDLPDYLAPLMKDVVAPQAQALWDAGNKGTDDEGNPDASKLDEKDWRSLLAAARTVKEAATSLAGPARVIVGPPGMKLQDQDAPGAASAIAVQGYIDKEPKAFTENARALASVADLFIKAAETRDAALLADASDKMDGICETCHSRFWYPQ